MTNSGIKVNKLEAYVGSQYFLLPEVLMCLMW